MNFGLLAVLAAGAVLYDKTDSRASQLGAMLVAGATIAVASKGGG